MLTCPALALCLDGTGLGDDGSLWGGEVFLAELTSFRRLAHLSQLRLPGGDAAAVEPWRMALAALHRTYGAEGALRRLPASLRSLERDSVDTVIAMLEP